MRFGLKLLFCTFFSLGSQTLYSQSAADWWYFGFGAGLHFTGDTVVADTSSTIYEGSGAITISDSLGNLMFYYGNTPNNTIERIWNKNHVPMPNGSGLITDVNAEQTTTALPFPKKSGKYLVFTVDFAGWLGSPGESNIGLFYHMVDMNLDNGLGDVVDSVKNIVLIDSTAEKIASVKHANGHDYWVVVQQCGSNKYHAFLVTENGVDSIPVTTAIGPVSSNYGQCSGGLRFSHSGDLLHDYRGDQLLYDFDRATGELSNLRSFYHSQAGETSEFSPDDTKLYTGRGVQFDVSLSNESAIEASAEVIYSTSGVAYAWQLGPNGRIYGVNWNFNPNGYMAVINNPNEPGIACGYQDSAVYLMGRAADQNTPNFPSSFFHTDFHASTGCEGDSTFFDINYHFIDSVLWDFGDPGSGALNTSTAVDGAHVYSANGVYTVTLIAQNGAKTDTITKKIHIEPSIFPDLGADTGFCLGQSITLNGQVPGQLHYQWSTGDTTETINVSVAGTYTLTVTPDSGCAGRDTINISAFEEPVFTLGADIGDCEQHVQSGIVLQGPGGQAQYTWSSGGSAPNETVFSYGTYTLTVTSADGCIYSDQVEVFPDTCLGIDAAARQYALAVYPNPSYGVFTLSASQPQPIQCAVFNSQGVLVKSVKLVGETKLDLSDHGAGIYTVTPEGSTLQPLQLVVY